MQTTSNLGLKKPDQNEYVNVEDLNYNADEMDKLGAPEFDDSGTVSGITSFPAYLTTLMSGTNLFTFFRNLKAGLKFVLHTGQLVNNGQTTEPGFALDARYGKTLADAVTQLNANLTNTFDTVQGTNCRVLYNRACVFIEINCTGISLTGGNFFNNVFALPPNVKLKTSVFATVTILDSAYTPFSPANDGTISIGSDGTFNVRCSTSVTNATITGHVTLPRSFFAIT